MKNLVITLVALCTFSGMVQAGYHYQTTNANSLQNIIASNFYN